MTATTWTYIILMIIALALLMLSLWMANYWKKHLKKKLESGEITKKTRKEDVQGSIATARTMLKLLEQRGVNITKAEALVIQAEMAMDARLYSKADDYLKEAKEEALRANKAHEDGTDILNAPPPSGKEEDSPKKVFDEFPPYYLQAKFEMKRAGDSIDTAEREGRDTEEAKGFLNEAKGHFDTEGYEKAFSMAVKARKSAEGESVEYIRVIEDEDTEEDAVEERIEVSLSKNLEVEAKDAIACVAEKLTVSVCPNCGAEVKDEDVFCRKCGFKLLFCPNCGASVEEEDIFCAKCGYRVKAEEEVYLCPECGKEVGSDDVFCPHCGVRFK